MFSDILVLVAYKFWMPQAWEDANGDLRKGDAFCNFNIMEQKYVKVVVIFEISVTDYKALRFPNILFKKHE